MANELYRTSITLPNGKRKWIRSKSKEGLEKKKKEIMLQIGAGMEFFAVPTFGEYAQMWLNIYKKPYLRRNSVNALQNALRNHIYPYLRDISLKDISPMHIQLLLAPLANSSKSLNDKVMQVLRGVFNAAADNNLISKSPMPMKNLSKGIKTKEKAALTIEQSARLLSAAEGTRAYLFCLIALQTGMRRGEICGLMWSDVDLDKQVIHVRHNAVFTNTQTIVSEALKTSAAVRDIPIPPTLQNALKAAQNGKKSEYVLSMENGKPLSQSSFSNLWQIIRRRTADDPAKLGTPAVNSKMIRTLDFHVTPHLLRHTYITRLFESGLDIKEIQYLAGHSTIDMTLRVYTHYQQETRKNDTAKKVREALG